MIRLVTRFGWNKIRHNLAKGAMLMDSADKIRQSDVTVWGVAALACGALAILSANLGGMLPTHLMSGLHATNVQSGSLNQLRAEVAALKSDAVRLRSENNRVVSLLTLAEQSNNTLGRRIGFIEASLPALFDTGPRGAGIDASLTTASVGENETETIETEGGTVVVSRTPFGDQPLANPKVQDRPEALDSSIAAAKTEPLQELTGPASAFGLALGPKVIMRDALVTWSDITRKAGPLLLGLDPILSGDSGADELQLVAGPISGYAEAEQVCARMVRIGIACLPVPYMGNALPE